jgi:hypothetical protein
LKLTRIILPQVQAELGKIIFPKVAGFCKQVNNNLTNASGAVKELRANGFGFGLFLDT